MMNEYIRKINYYETDKMGIVHHSNYVRIMEEARIDFLQKLGYSHEKLESDGFYSPVVAVSCKYRKPLRFPDEIKVVTFVKSCSGVGFVVGYEIYKEDELMFTGTSEHCITTTDYRIVRIKNDFPEFYNALCANMK